MSPCLCQFAMTFVLFVHAAYVTAIIPNSDTLKCEDLNPFAYAKCLRICSPSSTEATCIDDQLCLCNPNPTGDFSEEDEELKLSTYEAFGTKCKLNEYCQENCKEAGFHIPIVDGIFCRTPTRDFGQIQMCVCKSGRTNYVNTYSINAL